ncbi:MAG TPA: YbfB/YjiJ family MFS transporter [Noviherbaspirillum sp.]|jgi:predicted MFS family arabinose efflux permease|uniref:YbfB/YjiJ family MFS transporter n=1 Tax=Noviherbaspirillum sp. TaxID=1926288 RepID=UPI002DDCB7AC|nr:YbfB/YjiJ family MFS transporter [Noviherbaspirillum sp.]HEV2610343.1 YbfB/YjiJ family MFS transporter [Noviherbaspirillum sp.]
MPVNELAADTASSSPVPAALAGLFALAVAMGIGRFAFTPVLPMMLDDAGLSIAGGGLLASANYLGYLIGAVSAMFVRIEPSRAIRAGLSAIALTTLAMALKLPLAGWLVLRLAAGIASAWVLISVSAWCLETLARYQRPALNSIVFAGVGSGIAIAGMLCIALIAQDAGSARAWLALGLFSAVVTAVIWRFFPSRAAVAATAAQGRARVRWTGDSVRLVTCYGLFGFGYIIPATFLPVMAKRVLEDPTLFGWSWPVFGAAAALSTLAVAILVRRFGNRPLWVACHVVMAVGVALPVLWNAQWPQFPAILIAALFVGGTFMVITLCAMQEAKQVAGKDATGLIAAMTSAFAAGQIAGPLSIGVIAGKDGDFTHALLLAAALLVMSAVLLGIGRPGQPDRPRAAT